MSEIAIEEKNMVSGIRAQPVEVRNPPNVYLAGEEEVQIGVIYRGSMPQVGPMDSYNELQRVGNDLVLHRTVGRGKESVSQTFRLEELLNSVGGSAFALEEKALINFMINYREDFALSLFKEANLFLKSIHSIYKTGKIFCSPINHAPYDYAYLELAYNTTNRCSHWDLCLNTSRIPVASAPWNDLDGIAHLARQISEPMETLATYLALSDQSDSAKRTKRIDLFKKTDGQTFSVVEREKIKHYFQRSGEPQEYGNKVDEDSLQDMIESENFNIRSMDSLLTVDFGKIAHLFWDIQGLDAFASTVLAFDYSFYLPKGKNGEDYIRKIKEEIAPLGGVWIEILRRPSAEMGTHSFPEIDPLDYVLGIIVKNEDFFNENKAFFFQPEFGRKRALYDAMNTFSRFPSIQEIEVFLGYHL